MMTGRQDPTRHATPELSGRVAFVTGAGSGIGLAIAEGLAAAGATVVASDLRREAAEAAAANIRRAGGRAEPLAVDVADFDALRAALADAERDHGRVDILVNNAGFQHVAPIEEFALDRWQAILAVMLTAPFVATQAVLPGMKARGFGRIINMSSINGKIGAAFKAGYCSAKHGIIGLTRVTAIECGATGVTANAICPGYVDTPLVRNQVADLARNHQLPEPEVLERVVLTNVPQRRLLQAAEIADLAVFLCTDRAAGITGQAINVSAGFVMH